MEKEELLARLTGLEFVYKGKLEAVLEKRGIASGCSEDTLKYLEKRYIKDCETIKATIKYIKEN